MNHIRLLAIFTMMMLALTAVAQQAATQADRSAPDRSAKDEHAQGGVPAVEGHLKILTEKLDLTSNQQDKAKPILQQMQDSTHKFLHDENMSPDERMDNVKACRYKADRELRKILNDDQRKKLDQLEQEQHSELHGN